MYEKAAKYYDALYSNKDYAAQAGRLREVIATHKQSDGNGLLDIGCGTGQHLRYLTTDCDATGLDQEPAMLAVARERLPDTTFVEGDMRNFDLPGRFDVVICMFGAIAYALTEDALRTTTANFHRHLKPGGVCIVEPFLKPESFKPGHFYAQFVDEPDLKLVRMSTSTAIDNVMVLQFHYMVGENAEVRYFTEEHRLALFTEDQHLGAFRTAGFHAIESLDVPEFGRGLYVAVK